MPAVGLCTDSNSQIPPDLVDRYGVEVVPLTVTVDGEAYLEGVELDADAFYRRFEGGTTPAVATAAPSPGQFAAAYARLAEAGADEILSVHLGSAVSATCNAARLGADLSPVPVRLVDTGTASFAITACLWEAAAALGAGASIDDAAAVAEGVAGRVTNVFVVEAVALAAAGGRLRTPLPADGIPVLTLTGGEMKPIAMAHDLAGAADAMTAAAVAAGDEVRVGLGIADAAAEPMWRALEERLATERSVREVVRYRIGPSVGAHTGPGAAGVIAWPVHG